MGQGGHKGGTTPTPGPCPTLAMATLPRAARGDSPAVTAALGVGGVWGPQSPPAGAAAGSGGAPAPLGAPPLHTHQIAMCRWQRLRSRSCLFPATPLAREAALLNPSGAATPAGDTGGHRATVASRAPVAHRDKPHAQSRLGGSGDIPGRIVTLEGGEELPGEEGGAGWQKVTVAEPGGEGDKGGLRQRGQSAADTRGPCASTRVAREDLSPSSSGGSVSGCVPFPRSRPCPPGLPRVPKAEALVAPGAPGDSHLWHLLPPRHPLPPRQGWGQPHCPAPRGSPRTPSDTLGTRLARGTPQ